MIRRYRKQILLSSAVMVLAPLLAGLILWNRLPEQMATHWGMSGQVDGWSGRFFAVFGVPLLMLPAHLLCLIFTLRDPQNKGQSEKPLGLLFWVIPITTLFICAGIYASAFGIELNVSRVFLMGNGLLFAIMGNYFPKLKPNRTLGIRVTWTLESEENWNATHRFGGRVWVIGGLLMMACGFLPSGAAEITFIVLMIALAAIPLVYSYLYYKKQVQNGSAEKAAKADPKMRVVNTVFVVLLAILLFAALFTGNISVEYGADSFTVHSAYWADSTVSYDSVDFLEYRDTDTPGTRVNGFGSPRLLMGAFQNDEFGAYTRYSYTGCPSCVVLTSKGQTLVLNGKNAEATKVIYEELAARIG